MNQTASDNAEEFGFHAGDLVQEWLWDDDVDDSIRAKIEELTGEELVDEDYDSAVDGVIIWWRDGDDEDELSDTIVDAYAVLGDDGPLWVLTPKPGRPGAASSSTVQSAAKTAGMNAATPLTVSGDWNGIRLRAFGKGRRSYSFCPPRHAWPRSDAHIKAWNHTIPSLFAYGSGRRRCFHEIPYLSECNNRVYRVGFCRYILLLFGYAAVTAPRIDAEGNII